MVLVFTLALQIIDTNYTVGLNSIIYNRKELDNIMQISKTKKQLCATYKSQNKTLENNKKNKRG